MVVPQLTTARSMLVGTPLRRRITWLLLVLGVLFFFPGVLGVSASAQDGTAMNSDFTALSWMDVRDSSGVPLASYVFASDRGGSQFGGTVLWALIGLLFIGYMTIVTTAIWLIGFSLSFQWLDTFAAALRGVADALTGQIATPAVLLAAVTVGALCVGWFIVRGYHSKAAIQVVTMLVVAIVGPFFLADPLGNTFSSDGLLAGGRDLGISVAAGLNGDSDPQTGTLIPTMQTTLADNFASYPLQVWNFDHVLRGSCRDAWSQAMVAGRADQVSSRLAGCGDSAAQANASEISVGQIGIGLVLLICAAILLFFGAYLAFKLFKAALGSIYHGFMAIFGFAAGGFVYGPTQTFLVRNLVDSAIAAARMTAFTIFLGVYVLFLGNLFRQAQGQVLAVMVLVCLVVVGAIVQLSRLSAGLTDGGRWVANRFSLALQGAGSGAGGGSGQALGMGSPTNSGSFGGTALATVTAFNTINSSPVTAWLAGGVLKPFDPLSRKKMAKDRIDAKRAAMLSDSVDLLDKTIKGWEAMALEEAKKGGGIHTELGAAYAWKRLHDSEVPKKYFGGVLLQAGAHEEHVINVSYARGVEKKVRSDNPEGFRPRQKALAAAKIADSYIDDPAHSAFIANAVVRADSFKGYVSRIPPGEVDEDFVAKVLQNSSSASWVNSVDRSTWESINPSTRLTLGKKMAEGHLAAAKAYYSDRSEQNRDALRKSTRSLANLDTLIPDLRPWE